VTAPDAGSPASSANPRQRGRGARIAGAARTLSLDLTPLRTSRDFRLLFLSGGVTFFGSMITFVALPYQMYQLTRSPLAVGLLGLAELLPILVLSFVGGALADYVDRRRLVQVSEAALAGVCGLLVLNAVQDRPSVALLYVCASLFAALDAIQRPALDAMPPRLVPPEQLPAASALSSLRMNLGSVAGPAAGGVLIATVDLPVTYTVDLGTFLLSLLLLWQLRAVPPPPDADRPSLRGVLAGLQYAGRRPELMGTYLVDISAMFFAFPLALFPAIAERFGGAEVLGLLYAAPSVGSLLATLTSGWTSRVHRHGLVVVLAAACWGLAITSFGLADALPAALAFLALAGAADMISGLFRSVIWNQTIPDHLRGRLAGIEMISYTTGPLLGSVRAGGVAALTDVRTSIVSGGILCVLATGLLALALPAFLRYDGRDGRARKQALDAERARAVGADEI